MGNSEFWVKLYENWIGSGFYHAWFSYLSSKLLCIFFTVLYIFYNFFTLFSLPVSELSLVGLAHDLQAVALLVGSK